MSHFHVFFLLRRGRGYLPDLSNHTLRGTRRRPRVLTPTEEPNGPLSSDLGRKAITLRGHEVRPRVLTPTEEPNSPLSRDPGQKAITLRGHEARPRVLTPTEECLVREYPRPNDRDTDCISVWRG
nr:hypothetical protein Iba_chr14dCG1460 [Ipomoea batatas]